MAKARLESTVIVRLQDIKNTIDLCLYMIITWSQGPFSVKDMLKKEVNMMIQTGNAVIALKYNNYKCILQSRLGIQFSRIMRKPAFCIYAKTKA